MAMHKEGFYSVDTIDEGYCARKCSDKLMPNGAGGIMGIPFGHNLSWRNLSWLCFPNPSRRLPRSFIIHGSWKKRASALIVIGEERILKVEK